MKSWPPMRTAPGRITLTKFHQIHGNGGYVCTKAIIGEQELGMSFLHSHS